MTFELFWQIKVYLTVFVLGVITGIILMYFIYKDDKK